MSPPNTSPQTNLNGANTTNTAADGDGDDMNLYLASLDRKIACPRFTLLVERHLNGVKRSIMELKDHRTDYRRQETLSVKEEALDVLESTKRGLESIIANQRKFRAEFYENGIFKKERIAKLIEDMGEEGVEEEENWKKEENVKKERIKEEDVKKEDVKKEGVRKEGVKEEHVNEEGVKKEDVKKEDVKKEGVKMEGVKKEGVEKDDIKKEA